LSSPPPSGGGGVSSPPQVPPYYISTNSPCQYKIQSREECQRSRGYVWRTGLAYSSTSSSTPTGCYIDCRASSTCNNRNSNVYFKSSGTDAGCSSRYPCICTSVPQPSFFPIIQEQDSISGDLTEYIFLPSTTQLQVCQDIYCANSFTVNSITSATNIYIIVNYNSSIPNGYRLERIISTKFNGISILPAIQGRNSETGNLWAQIRLNEVCSQCVINVTSMVVPINGDTISRAPLVIKSSSVLSNAYNASNMIVPVYHFLFLLFGLLLI